MSHAATKAFVLWWRELDKWVIPPRFLLAVSLPKEWGFEKVSDLVEQLDTRQRVAPAKEYRMVGVKWYGEGTFHRETVQGKDTSATYLSVLRSGALVYNRLFAWKGSFAVVPPEHEGYHVSNEFPQFAVDERKALAAYLHLFFTSPRVTQVVQSASIGSAAVSRNRLKEEDFLSFEVPLPPLPVQKAIVAHWRKAQEDVAKAQESVKRVSLSLNERLCQEYRRVAARDVIKSRFFAVDFKDLERWDVKTGRAAAYRVACPSFRPMADFVEDATEMVRPFDQPEKDWPVYGVNNQVGVFFNQHQKGKDFNAPYKRIRRDWFFHNPTRSNVGSLGIVPEVPEDAITSPEYQVWKLKDSGSEGLLPGYVAVLIGTQFFVDVIQFYRVGAVKQRMYNENLMEVRIPCLPEREQRKYAEARIKALEEIKQAQERAEVVKAEVEEMILGKRPAPGT